MIQPEELEVGVKVKIREDLEIGKLYGKLIMSPGTIKYRGKELTIKDKVWGYIFFDDKTHRFTPEMIECVIQN